MLVFIAQHSKGYPLLMSRDGCKTILAEFEDEAGPTCAAGLSRRRVFNQERRRAKVETGGRIPSHMDKSITQTAVPKIRTEVDIHERNRSVL